MYINVFLSTFFLPRVYLKDFIVVSQDGETALFTAVQAGAQEAMEGLLIKGAKPGIRNIKDKRAEDKASNKTIRESLRMYTALLMAMNSRSVNVSSILRFQLNLD